MAVTRNEQIIRMTAANDKVTGLLQIQAIHAKAGLTLKDGSGNTLFITQTQGLDVSFPCKLQVDGLELDAGTGEVVVFLA